MWVKYSLVYYNSQTFNDSGNTIMIHPLENSLLKELDNRYIDVPKIKRILADLLTQEVYISTRTNSGKLYEDVLLKIHCFRSQTGTTGDHNKKINDIKIAKLQTAIQYIIQEPNLTALDDELNRLSPNQQDLTFLLSFAVTKETWNLKIVELLLDRGAEIDGIGYSGHRPIYIAIQTGSQEALQYLSDRGADFNQPDIDSKTPIHAALTSDQLSLIPFLKAVKCLLDEFNYQGQGPLHQAVLDGKREAVLELIHHGALLESKNAFGETPFDIAYKGKTLGFDISDSHFIQSHDKHHIINNRKILAGVLQDALTEQKRIYRILQALEKVSNGDIQLPHLQIQDKDIPLLIKALEKIDLILTLNLSNNPITTQGIQALLDYLEESTFICQLNLENTEVDSQTQANCLQRFNSNKGLSKLLNNYSDKEILPVIKTFSRMEANFDSAQSDDGWLLAHCAGYYGHAETLQFLLTNGIDINKTTRDDGYTALHLCAMQGYDELLKFLLKQNVLQVDSISSLEKETPLSFAIKNQHHNCAVILLAAGADPNYSRASKTVLRLAVELGSLPLCTLLVRNGAVIDLQVQDLAQVYTEIADFFDLECREIRRKELQLCQAVINNEIDEMLNLIKEKVDINCSDETGTKPLEHALSKKHWELAAQLLIHGADYSDINVFEQLREETEEAEEAREALASALSQLQVREPMATVLFLRSRTRYPAMPVADEYDINKIYEDLLGRTNKLTTEDIAYYARPVLEVAEYCHKLEIVFDPKGSDTRRINPRSQGGTRGNYSRDDDELQIAGKRDNFTYSQVRGTLIHELCHRVCDKVWKNESNPFAVNLPQARSFAEIVEMLRGNKKNLDDYVLEALEYDKEKHARELIVRVPQIIAVYGVEYAKNLCEKNEGFKALFNYYEDYVLPTLQSFISNTKSKKSAWKSLFKTAPNQGPVSEEQAGEIIASLLRSLVVQKDYHMLIVNSHLKKVTACLKALNLTSTCETLENEYSTRISQFSNYTFFDSYQHSKELVEQCKQSSNIFKVSM